MKRRMSCLAAAVILCLSLAAIGAVLQMLNVLPDSTERTATAQARALPTRIAAANATRHVELTASAEARVPTLTATATETETPAPSATGTAAATPDMIERLQSALTAHNIQSIDIAGDSQSRTVIIAVIVGDDSGQEVLDMLRAVGAVIEGEPTIGRVSLVTGNAAGQTTAIINVLLADVQAWRVGALSDEDFIGRMTITDM